MVAVRSCTTATTLVAGHFNGGHAHGRGRGPRRRHCGGQIGSVNSNASAAAGAGAVVSSWHARARHGTPAPLAIMSDHVDLAAPSHGVPPNPALWAWECLASHRLPVICVLCAGASCTCHCTPTCSSLASTCGVRLTTCVARPLHAPLLKSTERYRTSSSSGPTSPPRRTDL